ncbi:hypothetical protein [Chryseobacterium sp. Marseille-Q3244]|uniref:hypothetical protein n=1 Tax=Chryseobacterium sp. Marseille-Q3244 TaxID=2758092 RepID=UPI002024F5E2|nr:hypothetical protein [Chryseobacterium sp. Marseille-Q3244]
MKRISLLFILVLLSCNKQENKGHLRNNKEMNSLKNAPYNNTDEGDGTKSNYDDLSPEFIKTTIKINANWNGVYYYKPQSSSDSIGSYYIDIDQANSDFGFSGKNSFKFKVETKQEKDSLLLYNIKDKELIGKIYKKNNQFWIKSDLIKTKEKNKTNNVFLLQYAKSADDLD